MSYAFHLRIPKPIPGVDVQSDINTWLCLINPSTTGNRWHWSPRGISQPQFRDWQLDITDDQIATVFKIQFSEYIVNQIRLAIEQ